MYTRALVSISRWLQLFISSSENHFLLHWTCIHMCTTHVYMCTSATKAHVSLSRWLQLALLWSPLVLLSQIGLTGSHHCPTISVICRVKAESDEMSLLSAYG